MDHQKLIAVRECNLYATLGVDQIMSFLKQSTTILPFHMSSLKLHMKAKSKIEQLGFCRIEKVLVAHNFDLYAVCTPHSVRRIQIGD